MNVVVRKFLSLQEETRRSLKLISGDKDSFKIVAKSKGFNDQEIDRLRDWICTAEDNELHAKEKKSKIDDYLHRLSASKSNINYQYYNY